MRGLADRYLAPLETKLFPLTREAKSDQHRNGAGWVSQGRFIPLGKRGGVTSDKIISTTFT